MKTSTNSKAAAMPDGVCWHSQIAERFNRAYELSARFRERQQVWSELIKQYLPDGGAVLDAGCGPGSLCALTIGSAGTIVAFDASPEMVVIARRRLGADAEIHTARVENASQFGNDRFDLVLCSSVLEYVEDFATCFRALARSTKPHGHLLISMPNAASVYRALERIAFGLTGYPKYYQYVRNLPRLDHIARFAGSEGLTVVERRTYGAAPVVGVPMRGLGAGPWTDTLVVFVLQRTS